MLRTKLTVLVFIFCLLSGCVRDIPLDIAKSQQIDKTELYLCKQQDNLVMPAHMPSVCLGFDPATIIVGTVAINTLSVLWRAREQSSFAPIKEDLADYNLEQKLSESMSCTLQENKHFKFSDITVVKIEDDKDVLHLLRSADSRYVAFIIPEYVLLNNMDAVIINTKLSVYDKTDLGCGLKDTKLPKPIYQTKAFYKYLLPERGWFSHVNNAKRFKENNSKLLISTLDEGVTKTAEQLTKNVAEPHLEQSV